MYLLEVYGFSFVVRFVESGKMCFVLEVVIVYLIENVRGAGFGGFGVGGFLLFFWYGLRF